MTDYDVREASTYSGAPIECYEFIGTFATYRYTSADTDQTLGGNTYTATDLVRDAINVGTHDDDTLDLRISVRSDLEMVKQYMSSVKPPDLSMTLYRTHVGISDYSVIWKGNVAGFSVSGARAAIRVPSVFGSVLSTAIPNYYWQRSCNHVLYNDQCGLSRATHTTTAFVTGVSDTIITISILSNPLDTLKGGEMYNTTRGEYRHILSNNNGVIKINTPFKDIRVGDTVEVTKGCDHSLSTCKNKFGNSANFGGCPFIPTKNPFEGRV